MHDEHESHRCFGLNKHKSGKEDKHERCKHRVNDVHGFFCPAHAHQDPHGIRPVFTAVG